MTPPDITDVILVGGSSRIPYLQTKLEAMFPGVPPHADVNPDEAVAVGAALLADRMHRAVCVG